MKKRGPGRPRKHPLPSPLPSPPLNVVELSQSQHRDRERDRAGERTAGGRGWEGDTVKDTIESVVQGQRRKGQKRKRWDRDGDEEELEEEDGEVVEREERPEQDVNLGSKAETGRSWLSQDEAQQLPK